MSARLIVFAIFAMGAIVAYPKAVMNLVVLWFAIALVRYVW